MHEEETSDAVCRCGATLLGEQHTRTTQESKARTMHARWYKHPAAVAAAVVVSSASFSALGHFSRPPVSAFVFDSRRENYPKLWRLLTPEIAHSSVVSFPCPII